MKICFIITSLEGGGAERVAATLATELFKRGHTLHFIVNSSKESNYNLDESIGISSLFKKKQNNNSLFNKIWRKITFYTKLNSELTKLKPDVVVSFLKGTNRKAILVSYIKGIPHIATEHTIYKNGINDFWTQIERRYIYKLASAVTVLIEKDLEEYYSKYLNNVVVMHNPLPFDICSTSETKEKFILTAGELHRWERKGFDKLIKIFSLIHEKNPEWRLKIAGNGEEGKQKLKKIAKELNVDDKIDFLGFVKDMPELYRKASIFALHSKNEGFGMVLIEAMSQGCPCISLNTGFGPSVIINDEIDGVLVEDKELETYANKLNRIMSNEEYRKNLSENAVQNVARYSANIIVDQWEKLFDKVIRN